MVERLTIDVEVDGFTPVTRSPTWSVEGGCRRERK
jgi:hypothetical protein